MINTAMLTADSEVRITHNTLPENIYVFFDDGFRKILHKIKSLYLIGEGRD